MSLAKDFNNSNLGSLTNTLEALVLAPPSGMTDTGAEVRQFLGLADAHVKVFMDHAKVLDSSPNGRYWRDNLSQATKANLTKTEHYLKMLHAVYDEVK